MAGFQNWTAVDSTGNAGAGFWGGRGALQIAPANLLTFWMQVGCKTDAYELHTD